MSEIGLDGLINGGEMSPPVSLPAIGKGTSVTAMKSGDFYVTSRQAPKFGVTKATLARWATPEVRAIGRYGTPRKALYLASEIISFLHTGKGIDGQQVFKTPICPLEKLHRKEGALSPIEKIHNTPAESEVA